MIFKFRTTSTYKDYQDYKVYQEAKRKKILICYIMIFYELLLIIRIKFSLQ